MKNFVRRADVDDASIISDLNQDVQATHAAGLPWLFKPAGPQVFSPSTVSELLIQGQTLMHLALADHIPVGYIYAEIRHYSETSYRYAFDEIYIHHISVRPTHRSRGVGSKLLDAIMSDANQRGIPQIAADFWIFNEPALSFFKKHGFETYNQRAWLRKESR